LSDQQIIDLIDHDDFILPDGERLPLERFWRKSVRPASMAFLLRQRRRHLYPLLRRPGQRPQRRGHRTLCIVAPGPMRKNYNDYRRVLIDSANSLARRINE
jgi:hypothetical protein